MPYCIKYLAAVGVILSSITTSAQMKVHTCKDTDGKELMVTEYGGSAMSAVEVSRGKTVFYTNEFYFTDLLDTICLPLRYRSNPCITNILYNDIEVKEQADESLQWLNAVKAGKKYTGPYSSTFSAEFKLTPVTNFRLPLLPYRTTLNDTCSVMYYAHNYGSDIRQIDSLNGYTLYLINNAVLLNREENFYWLYISDGSVTDGTQRLRHQAIISARFIGNKVVIERQNSSIEDGISVVVINYETGRLISYSINQAIGYYVAYSWNDATPDLLQLILSDNTTQTISLKD
jgi:hypothetical protein